MTQARRHCWGPPMRFRLKTERECLNLCGCVKVTKHENDLCWTEYWRRLDNLGDRAPVCEPVMVAA
jgi:hypothetical protein